MSAELTLRCLGYIEKGYEASKNLFKESAIKQEQQQQKSLVNNNNKSTSDGQSLIQRAVILLMTFFNLFEGKSEKRKSSHSTHSHYMSINTLRLDIPIRHSLSGETKKVSINYHRSTIGEIKQKASEQFGLPPRNFRFRLTNKKNVLESDDDDEIYKEINTNYAQSGLILVPKDPSQLPDPDYHPSTNIASAQAPKDYYKMLFDVLSIKDLSLDCQN